MPEVPIHPAVAVPEDGAWADARAVVDVLTAAGHESYIAGGAVRDLLLGRPVHEIDIATAAAPDAVAALFPRTVAVGRAFGVMVVVLDGERSIEVATFRSDGCYVDGRRPTGVRFATSAEDVERRDFTVNAMLLDPRSGRIIDLVGGRADLDKRVLRAVGDARARLHEDRLRVLRALRQAAVLGFAIEASTWAACQATTLEGVSRERIIAELGKALRAGAGGAFCIQAAKAGRLDEVTPGLAVAATATLLDRLGCAPEDVLLAAWLHSLGPTAAQEWITRQPMPAVWRRDVPWLIASASGLASAGVVVRRRALRDGRADRLVALACGLHPDRRSEMIAWKHHEDSAGPYPISASDLIAGGMASGPEIGRALRAGEEAWLAGTLSTRADLLAWLLRERHA